jgi:hypothetical protein
MIGTQIGTHNRSEMVAVLGTPCAIPSHYSNSNSTQMEDDSPKKLIYAEKVLLIQCILHCYYKQTCEIHIFENMLYIAEEVSFIVILKSVACIWKMMAFWDIAPCSLVEVDQHFRGVYCLHHQGDNDGGSMHL